MIEANSAPDVGAPDPEQKTSPIFDGVVRKPPRWIRNWKRESVILITRFSLSAIMCAAATSYYAARSAVFGLEKATAKRKSKQVSE